MSEHNHTHNHTHAHTYAHGSPSDDEDKETFALLRYMLSHNRHHADELRELSAKLKNTGRTEAADMLSEAILCFEKGNSELEKVVGLIGE